jgi:hypothetical protein
MALKNNNPGRILKGTKSQPTLKSASGIWTLDEALQAHRANQWPQPNLYQPISNSARNSISKTSYYSVTPGRPGNQQKWTLSLWVKRSSVGSTSNTFFTAGTGTTDTTFLQLYFKSSDTISISGYTQDFLVTTQVFRDISAWYHVVIAFDSTQATAANRISLYINGTQVTSFATDNRANIVQGASYSVNSASTYNIGRSTAVLNWFDGYLSEVNLIDGFKLQPSLFGQLDANNTWVPIPYTGSYGTNGFYLPFTNMQSSQTLGYDASLNGTPTYNADQDPYRSSVSLHLTGNGPAGGQNNYLLDSSPNNLAVTRNGNVSQGSFSPYPKDSTTAYDPDVHGASMWFPGTASDYLTLPGSSNWALGSTATIEMWVYPTYNNAGNVRFLSTINTTAGIDIYFNGAATTVYMHGGNVGTTTSMTLNQWTHLAIVYNSGTVSIYFNGVSQTLTGTTTGYNITNTGTLYVGNFSSPGSGFAYQGYMTGVKITKNAAIYTSNFVPANKPYGTLTNNLLTSSEQFNVGQWSTSYGSITTNAAIAPDGTPTATLFQEDTTNNQHLLYAAIGTISSGVTYTMSCYAKAYTGSTVRQITLTYNGGGYPVFDLVAGVVVTTSNFTSASITSVGNGWYRCSVTAPSFSTTGNFYTAPWNSSLSTQVYTGNGASGYYIWGVQLEQTGTLGNYTPTPANPSLGSAITLLLNTSAGAVVDSSGSTNAITYSAATITNVSKFGSGALYFNGSSYLDVQSVNGVTSFGTGDFTVECWWRANGTQSSYAPIISQGLTSSPPAGTWALKVNGSANNNLQFTYDASLINVGQNINPYINPNDGSWHHIAVSRNFSKLYMFIDGTIVGNASIPSSEVVGNTTSDILIGYESRDSVYLNGTVDDLRVTKGVARYIDNFVAPNRALPEVGGKSFTSINVNAGIVKTFVSNSSTSTINSSWTCPPDVTQVEVLVVAGGGGGGVCYGGGGGGGGVIYNNAYPVVPGQTYAIQVGQGGTNQVNVGGNGGPGTNSSFGNLVAIGGGYGGGNCGNTGGTGGSGGGGSSNSSTAIAGGSGTAGQGFSGSSSPTNQGGGGGGAGAAGAATSSQGANGLQFGISGTPTYYAGGGTGGQASTTTGGLGGGGTGGTALAAGVANATVNTGGGGGGSIISGTGVSGLGGSGIVIVRYTTNAVANSSDYTTDNLVDSPTLYGHDLGNGGEVVGNYATWNPLDISLAGSPTANNLQWSNANLTIGNSGGGWAGTRATLAYPSSGKYYYEVTIGAGSGAGLQSGIEIGIINSTQTLFTTSYLDANASAYVYRLLGIIYGGGSNLGYLAPAYTTGDVIGVAFDSGAGNLTFYKNGVSVYSFTGLSGSFIPAIAQYAVTTTSTNFGQRPWQFAPPAGFSALTSKNLPRPTGAALTPNQHFDVVTWTGNGSSQTITLPGGFQPDMIWIKNRTGSYDPMIMDSVRGNDGTHYYALDVSSTVAQSNQNATWFGNYGYLSAITSTGFTVNTGSLAGGNFNTSGYNYVAWCWKAGNGTVTNTNGSVTSTVSVNAAAGFSIVSYAGGQSGTFTIGHGLNSAPNIIITKSSTSADGWIVYYTVNGTNTNWATLNSTAAQGSNGGPLTGGALLISNATTLQISSGAGANDSTSMIAYCWTAVPGFSQFGTYTANGTVDSAFVYCGFKPRFIMLKDLTSTGSGYASWVMLDTARQTYNPATGVTTYSLYANLSNIEGTRGSGSTTDLYNTVDILSNGFKIRGAGAPGETNNTSDTYIYMAFAQNPFGNANGTAR